MYYLYILKCKDGTLYSGITVDLERRINEHNGLSKHGLPTEASAKAGAKYTKSRRPVKLVYTKRFKDRSTALKAEYKVKLLSRGEKLKLIKSKDF